MSNVLLYTTSDGDGRGNQQAGTDIAYSIDLTQWAPSTPTPTPVSASSGSRLWHQVQGGDRTLLTTPFQTTATWITSGTAINLVHNAAGSVLQNYFIPPLWISRSASDILCTFIDPSGTIPSFKMRVPAGAYSESFTTPGGSTLGDNSAAFIDTSIPYKGVTINGCYIGSSQGNASPTAQVSATNNVIVAQTGMTVQDLTGPMLMDAITKCTTTTAWQNSDNVLGRITDYDLTQCNADPNYVIQHATCLNLGRDVFSNTSQVVWPFVTADSGGTGSVPEGTVWGIPASTVRPTGKSRGFNGLFDMCQWFGLIFNNVTEPGSSHLSALNISSANQALLADMSSQFSSVMKFLALLNYQNGLAGAQYSVATLKGRLANATGWSDARPAPPTLDYSATNGVPVKPSSFGAWQGAHGVGTAYDTIWANAMAPLPTQTPAGIGALTFSDNFSTFSIHNQWQTGDKWGVITPGGTPPKVGQGGPSFGEFGHQWWVNPFNTNTPISGLYSIDNMGLKLGLMVTPSAYQSYIDAQAGTHLGYVGTLLNSYNNSYQKYGYWSITVSVPTVRGFSFQMDIENVQVTNTWPPEIDLRIYTDSTGLSVVLFEVATSGASGGTYAQWTTSSAQGFDITAFHTYGWKWASDFITFYIDGSQVWQIATPIGQNYTTNPMFIFLLTGANYIGIGDPASTALPAYAHVSNISVYALS